VVNEIDDPRAQLLVREAQGMAGLVTDNSVIFCLRGVYIKAFQVHRGLVAWYLQYVCPEVRPKPLPFQRNPHISSSTRWCLQARERERYDETESKVPVRLYFVYFDGAGIYMGIHLLKGNAALPSVHIFQDLCDEFSLWIFEEADCQDDRRWPPIFQSEDRLIGWCIPCRCRLW